MLATFLDGTTEFEGACLGSKPAVRPIRQGRARRWREILAAVRAEGDAAVQRYNERFGRRAPTVHARISGRRRAGPPPERRAPRSRARGFTCAAFHEHEKDSGFRYETGGVTSECAFSGPRAVSTRPGQGALPSSVVMSASRRRWPASRDHFWRRRYAAISARIRCSPPRTFRASPHIVDAGGAQAIAAPPTDAECSARRQGVGPGNILRRHAPSSSWSGGRIDGSPVRVRSSSSPTTAPIPVWWRPTFYRKPSTTKRPTPCSSARPT